MQDAGTLRITFDDCRQGTAVYSGHGQLPADTLHLQRLTQAAGFGCGGASAPPFSGTLHRGINGAWFDPDRDGEGWIVELLDDSSALVFWFTYDQHGKPAWLISIAQVDGNRIFAETAHRPVGGRFGPNFNPGQVRNDDWGAFALSFVGCNHATMAYGGVAPFGNGGLSNVTRLVGINNADPCAFPGGLRSLAGELEAAPYSVSDGDTNDPNSTLRPNDTPSQTQRVQGNPAAISGFASAEGVGGQGRFADVGDEVDEFRMNLTAGQSVQLIISDWDEANPGAKDLDLLIYSASNTQEPVYTSQTTSRNEFWQVTESGVYDVLVVAYRGASNYTLAASFAPVPQDFQALSSLGDFVPGEVIVRFDEDDADQAHHKSDAAIESHQKARAQALGLKLERAAIDGPVLMSLDDFGPADSLMKSAGIETGRTQQLLSQRGYGLGRAGEERRSELIETIKALQARPDVRYAEPNGVMYLQSLPSDPDDWRQAWHYGQINAPQAWSITPGSPDVIVAVIDTGVADHPDLNANILRNLGITFSQSISPPARGFPERSDHGTHVAGTIAAVAGNGRGGKGVAPHAKIMPINAYSHMGDQGGFTVSDVADSIRYAAGLASQAGVPLPARKASTINMSLGGPGSCPSSYQEAIDQARSQGLIVIAAAGNDTSGYAVSPAGCQHVVSVSATNRREDAAFYSNCGGHIDVAAPGGETAPEDKDEPTIYGFPRFAPNNPYGGCRTFQGRIASKEDGVYSTVIPGYGHLPGTSMAAPHVAGVVALMKSVHPGLTPAQFDQLLAAGKLTRDLGPSGWDSEFGHGLIDARKAVEAAMELAGGAPAPAVLVVEPASVDFGETNDRLTIRLRKSGSGQLIPTQWSANMSWIQSLTPIQTDADGFGTYEVRISRQGLTPGEYQGNIAFTTAPASQSPVSVQLSMRVGQPQTRGDAGMLYLQVIDAFTGRVFDELYGSGHQGRYTFEINGLVPGAYVLIATSDNDYDYWVCDPGEFCGFYPNEPGALVIGDRNVNIGTVVVHPDLSGLGQTTASSNTLSDFNAAAEKSTRPFGPIDLSRHRLAPPPSGQAKAGGTEMTRFNPQPEH
ncbi:MAG: S8 family serine peptidase [Xanthomonadales bacterium]|nr:S8 family serine peptidase [Xanthomonadales bacterium]